MLFSGSVTTSQFAQLSWRYLEQTVRGKPVANELVLAFAHSGQRFKPEFLQIETEAKEETYSSSNNNK